ncbi:trypsin-like peptidase domain-containing protein [Lentzea sp. CA-135723]|uniref:nSTAND1 domain-containing NTPase n=1 Tax=Lentzea sp. CA-135723 TaxID=3239950 RepID=UPI003D94644E
MSGLGADPLDPAVIRLRAGTRIVGAGFLVAPDIAATCAHVLGDEAVVADFPLLRSRDHAVEVLERDDEADVAILRLADPPAGALPVAARITGDVRDHRFRTFGFPHDLPDGIWVTGRLVGAQGAGRIQMAQDPDHWRIEPGFSGAPVWDEELAGVVGMVVTYTARNNTTAHLVPTTALGHVWTTPAQNPYRGLRPFEEEHASLFHGRDEDADRLAELLARQDVVAIAGPSGSGKSSLVRAGLLPRLRAAGAKIVELGADDEVPGDPEPGTVLVLDQFEEVVVANPAAAKEKLAAITRLVAARAQRPGAVRAVLTLRSRSLDDLITRETVAELNRAVWFLEPMSRGQLAAAIERPAAAVGGLAFESGLVQRILDDTRDEPGTLPLVSLVLDQLWRHRYGGWLAHQAYEELGRVQGALSNAADDVLASLTPAGRTAARTLLTGLTQGGYARRSALLPDLDPEIRDIAHDLAGKRLVVIHEQTVNLIHQALIDHWPTLRDWLAEDAEFLTWLAKLHDLHGSGGQLVGAPLVEASDWLRGREDAIPAPQRAFIRQSQTSQRRTQRRWRVITAVSVTFGLLASLLAGVVVRNLAELDDQLRSNNALSLAQAANRDTEQRPVEALQQALAAYREKPGSADAYGALFQQRIYWRGVDRVLTDELFTDVMALSASADGRVVVLRRNDTLTVWWDLLGPDARHRDLPRLPGASSFTLSPDGRRLVEAGTGRPSLRVWDLTRQSDPVVLEATAPLRPATFSANSRYLAAEEFVVLRGSSSSRVRVWDLDTARELPSDLVYGPQEPGLVEAYPTSDGSAVVAVEDSDSTPAEAMLRDRATGAGTLVFRASGTTPLRLVGNGTGIITCADSTTKLIAALPGAPAREFPEPQCPVRFSNDATGRYLISGYPTENSEPPALLDLKTLERKNLSLAWTVADNDSVITPAEGGLRTITLRSRALEVRSVATRDYVPRPKLSTNWQDHTPDNKRFVAYLDDPGYKEHSIVLVDENGTFLHSRPVPVVPDAVAFDVTGERVLVVNGPTLQIYRTDGMVLEREAALPTPPGRSGQKLYETSHSSVSPGPDGQTYVAHLGIVSTWDLHTGTQTRPPLTAVDNTAEDWQALRGGPAVMPRPRHREHLLVGIGTDLAVWNSSTLAELHRFDVGYAEVAQTSADGSIAAASGADRLTLVDLTTMRALPPLNAPGQTIINSYGDYLFTKTFNDLVVWNWKQRRQLVAVKFPSSELVQAVEGDRFLVNNQPWRRESITLDAAQWFRELCGLANREFTQAEKDALPQGVSTERPCTG